MTTRAQLGALFRAPPAPAPRGASMLGMTSPSEPLRAEALALRDRVRAAGALGYAIDLHDVAEVLSAHDLYRRGELEPMEPPGAWKYRAKRAANVGGDA